MTDTLVIDTFDPETWRPEIERRLSIGESVERVIAFMRAAGLRKMDSIRVLRRAAKITMTEAKIAVHDSPTWADRRASDEAFHDALFDALPALRREIESELDSPKHAEAPRP